MMPTSEKHVTLVLVPYAFSFPQIELGTYLSEGKMLCTKCKSDTKVAESRPRNETTWRRRKCLSCGTQFRTIEILEPVVAQPKPKPKPKPEPKPNPNRFRRTRYRKPLPSIEVEPDFDEMSDDELEAFIFSEGKL